MSARILIMAGGTGGHIFPALAVARELMAQGVSVSWLGTPRGLEAELVPKAGIDIDWVNIAGLRGKGLLGWLAAPWRVSKAVLQAMAIMRRRRPDAVLGMGGFVTGPGGLAAWLLRKPLLVHEQNSIPGMTNRFLARLAQRVMTAFPVDFKTSGRVLDAGNPIREELTRLPEPAERLAGHQGSLRLLVLGGSLGALALNQAVPRALAMFAPGQRPEVWHQTGGRHLDNAREAYAEADVEARVAPFIDDMAEAYGWADVVVCRAGALTVSELAAVGVAAILVPFPFAVDDHQTTNARYLVERGAGVLMPQDELTAESLYHALARLEQNRQLVLDMATAARQLARPRATRDVAQQCLEVAGV